MPRYIYRRRLVLYTRIITVLLARIFFAYIVGSARVLTRMLNYTTADSYCSHIVPITCYMDIL